MSEKFDVFKCDLCKSVIQVMHGGSSSFVCCDTPMIKMDDSNQTGATETHIPIVEKTDKGLKISVGSKLHTNTEAHTLYWVEVINGNKQTIVHLGPGDESIVEIPCCASCSVDSIKVREYCDLHGLWEAKK